LNGDENDAAGEPSETSLYETAQKFINKRFWQDAIEVLQSLEENYPFGEYAEQAQLELIYAYYKSNELEAVSVTADRFIRLHPKHRQLDYAYYMKGLATFTRHTGLLGDFTPIDLTTRDPGQAQLSFSYFSDLVNRFPTSDYKNDAIKRMEFLRNLLARHEIHVANYYFERGAYLAAANRGRYVVEQYQQTPAVPDALAIMAQGYHLLGLNNLSQDSIAVLQANYPGYPAFDNKGAFDFSYATGSAVTSAWIKTLSLGLFNKVPAPEFDTRNIYNPK
jgi:outer membrane protein assembly factor BamD